jgi:hypothetical protein
MMAIENRTVTGENKEKAIYKLAVLYNHRIVDGIK